MRSNEIAFTRETPKINEILNETEKVANYNGLSGKGALQLRLLAEEVCGMIDSLVQFFEGVFWIEGNKNKYDLCLLLEASEMSKELKNDLLSASTSGKNALARGVIGKIRDVADNFSMWNEDSIENIYRKVKEATSEDAEVVMWDDIGKSILSKLADKVLVGVRGSKIEITVKKTI